MGGAPAGRCFLLALLVPLVPLDMPLVVGSLLSLNRMVFGLVLRRVAWEATSP
jgi:hypothetical protein